MVMSGSYDLRLVALSVVIAVLSLFAALDLAGRVTDSQNKSRFAWLIGGSAAMGLGIWSMHYIGMLAFSLPMQMFYDPATVFVSLLAAIIASAVALFTVSRTRMGAWQVVLGSVCMGSDIASTHYIGMASLRVSAHVSYNPWLVICSATTSRPSGPISSKRSFSSSGNTTRPLGPACSWISVVIKPCEAVE
jgi:methyl-accepting chemotaxis protein PixJ